jgi:hypothetical protein
MIIALGSRTGLGAKLQALSSLQLAIVAMGTVTVNVARAMGDLTASQDQGSYLPGVLALGRFRTWNELKGMTSADMRRAAIDALASLTSQPATHFQSMSDDDLAGAAGVLVFLRETRARTDEQLKTITADDQRNLMIVAVGPQTGRTQEELQRTENIRLCAAALGGYSVVDLPQ